MSDFNTGTTDVISTAPFVDDSDIDEDNQNKDDEDVVDSSDPDAVEAENEVSDSNDDSKDDSNDDISTKLDKISDAINKLVNDKDKNKEKAMLKVHKQATDDSGTVEDPKTPEEVLDTITEDTENFDKAQDDAKTLDPQVDPENVGDNYNGSEKDPKDTVSTPEDEPVSTATAMHLVDSYIKAGVIAEANRYSAIERISKLSKSAAVNQLKAVKLVTAATDRKIAKIVKAASVKKANDGWEEDNPYDPGVLCKEFSNGIEGWVGDADGNGFGYSINDSNGNDLVSKDGFDSIEEAEAAADAWYEANKQDTTASRHIRHASRKAILAKQVAIRKAKEAESRKLAAASKQAFLKARLAAARRNHPAATDRAVLRNAALENARNASKHTLRIASTESANTDPAFSLL